jgi:hypothetical protein
MGQFLRIHGGGVRGDPPKHRVPIQGVAQIVVGGIGNVHDETSRGERER